jgi:uncharacterized protein DUF3883
VASNYEAICEENRRRYGTEGAQKSGGLAAGLYEDRHHFIFELLQNAEDAIGRRGEWEGSRTVTFTLNQEKLTMSHFGEPFNEADVRSVCDIAESTKNEFTIGRFGLGFKSVYTVTDLPEIHSGEEDFAIEDYVFPKQANRTPRVPDETQIVLPLSPEDQTVGQEITAGFRNLGPDALLFLSNIQEINWKVEGGESGFYIRNPPEILGPNVRRVMVIGQETAQDEVDRSWLVFHRDVFSSKHDKVGQVEVAFSTTEPKEPSGQWSMQPLATSPLVVFFPTVIETHLGFLVQGPYLTTPSRESIPPSDPWNQHLVMETSNLLIEAMRWMRDEAILNTSVLRCLPLEPEKFQTGSRFAPVFDAVRQSFLKEELLPANERGYVSASHAKLARTQELRDLFSPDQVSMLFKSNSAAWLSGDITQDKAPEIRLYLMQELEIDEIRPENLLPNLTKSFLEAQTDEWILRFYDFLSGQEKALRRHIDTIPFIRLDDGSHVVARENGKANAFLPSDIVTSFPTMRNRVCASPEVRQFLESLGITEPDPVDDVIWNLLPKYREEEIDVDDSTYTTDIERILAAFNSDSATQREKLRNALRDTNFIMAVDTGNKKPYISKPSETYIATDRLQQLFADVPGVLIVDNNYKCLRGEDIRDLLVSCGASRYLAPKPIKSELGKPEKEKIRREAGLERASWENQPEDFTLRGLKQFLTFLPTLNPEDATARATILWQALADLETRGVNAFFGSYKWGYFHETKSAQFDASFVRLLNQVAWVPNGKGGLILPSLAVFDTLDWRPSPFLQTKITFKPPIIDHLAKEAGFDPDALDLLRKLGITSAADVMSRLGVSDVGTEIDDGSVDEDVDVYTDAYDLYGDGMPDIPGGYYDPDGDDDVGRSGSPAVQGGGGGNRGGASGSGNGRKSSDTRADGAGAGGKAANNTSGRRGKRAPGSNGGRPFISYIGSHPDDGGPDPDGLDQAKRMQIEAKAIRKILDLEPDLRQTAGGNKGFDLYKEDDAGNTIRWVEVKSMTGSLKDRPVGMSRAQFNLASEKRAAFWIYVVEYALDIETANVLRIQDPAGRARTFTYDSGWLSIAETVTKA